MTKDRLIEAIKANDQDGLGIARVKEAASATIAVYGKDYYPMWCKDPKHCVLAIAWTREDLWSKDDLKIKVGVYFFRSFPEELKSHEFRDVVIWYDSFSEKEEGELKAAEIIYDWLKEEEDGFENTISSN